ncbi:c-type cytochrome [Croceibacterium ferulae]|uniref:c-type cytochrome n=1 Tax=Croceibacterium ferulae TaxID=1854641 RepID=UPI000EB2010E|nr:c-type cytochrome [Croceibacterium ferulae]
MNYQALLCAGAVLLAVGGASFVPSVAAQPAPNGEAVFRQRCAACHQIAADRAATAGPNLFGVVGRQAGAGTFKYSAAMKASDLTWTPANLDRFLASPTNTVRGTRMFVALPDAAQRRAVIDYLGRAK